MLKKKLFQVNSFYEWEKIAIELDKLEGKEEWKKEQSSALYDFREVEKVSKILKNKRELKDVKGLVHFMRANLVRNLFSINNPNLYQHSKIGTKKVIEDLQKELKLSLEFIAEVNEKHYSLNQKIEFFSESRHAYGRTALMLSGGAAMGMYHTGVVSALYSQNLLPRILCGSSAGSIIAAIICTHEYEEIPKIIEENEQDLLFFEYKNKSFPLLEKVFRYFTRGGLLDIDNLAEFVRSHTGDLTFQEAFDKTGWILNITVTGYKDHDNNRILNYITSPNVLIWSAVCASCSVPGLFDPVELLCKNEFGHIVAYTHSRSQFIDGSIASDLPMIRLAELFNVNNFIVSQTNPWVVPWINDKERDGLYTPEVGFNLRKALFRFLFSELKHRLSQIAQLNILPSGINRAFNLITQNYHGNVTISPAPRLSDYFRLISNPTKQEVQSYKYNGTLRTYPKMSYINALLSVELEINKHYQNLKKKMKKIYFSYEKKKYKGDDDLEKPSLVVSKNFKDKKEKEEENRKVSEEEGSVGSAGEDTDDMMEKIVEKNNKFIQESRVQVESDASLSDFKFSNFTVTAPKFKRASTGAMAYQPTKKNFDLPRNNSFIEPTRSIQNPLLPFSNKPSYN